MRKTRNRKLRRFQAVILSVMLACTMVSPAMAEELSSSPLEISETDSLLSTTELSDAVIDQAADDTSGEAASSDDSLATDTTIPEEEISFTDPSEEKEITLSDRSEEEDITFSEETSTSLKASAAEQVEILGFTKLPEALCFPNDNHIMTDLVSGNDLTAQLKLKIPTGTLLHILLEYHSHYQNEYGEDDMHYLTISGYRPTMTPVAGTTDTYTVDLKGSNNTYSATGIYKLERIYIAVESGGSVEYTLDSGLSLFQEAPEIQVINDNDYFSTLPYGTVIDTYDYGKPLMQYTFQGKNSVIPEGLTLRLRQGGNILGSASASNETLTIDGTVDVENIFNVSYGDVTVNGTLLTDQLKLGGGTFTINGYVSAGTITNPQKITFGPEGKLAIKSDLKLWTDDKEEVHELLKHIAPEEGYEASVRLLPYSDDQAPYTYKNGGWRQEVSLPSTSTEITTTTINFTASYVDKWYRYVIPSSGYYDFNPTIDDYDDGGYTVEAWRDTTLDVFFLNAYNELELVSTLEENPYFDGNISKKAYRMNRAYLTQGTKLWIHLVNESGGPGSFQVKKVTPTNSWLDSSLDLTAATKTVTYDKDCYQVTINIPIKDLAKVKTLNDFGIEVNVPASSYTEPTLLINDRSISNGKLVLKSGKMLMPPEYAGQTINLESGRIFWSTDGDSQTHYADYVTASSMSENVSIDTDSNSTIAHLTIPALAISVKCSKYQAGTMTSGQNYTQGLVSLYHYTLTVPSLKDANGYELNQCYCFSAINDSKEYEINGGKVSMTSYQYANPHFEIINNSTGKALASSSFLYDNDTHNMQVNLKAGTYTVIVNAYAWADASFGLTTFTFHVLQNSQTPLATSVSLGKQTVAPGEHFPLTVKYDGNFKLANVSAEFSDASGKIVKAKLQKVTSSTIGSITATLALEADYAKAGDQLSLKSVTMTDLYGKSSKQTVTGSLRLPLTVTDIATRIKSGEKTFSFTDISNQNLNIPAGVTVNADSVYISMPYTFKVAGTLNAERLNLSGDSSQKIRPLITGTINTYYLEASNIYLADGSNGKIVLKSEAGNSGFAFLTDGDPDVSHQSQLAGFLRMIQPESKILADGSRVSPTLYIYYPAIKLLGTFIWDPVNGYWDNGRNPSDPAGVVTNCGITMDDKTVVYNGKPQTITAENVGTETRVYYYYSKKLSTGGYGKETTEPPVEPGTYQVRAHFSIPKGYDEPLDDEYAILTILPQGNLPTPVLSSASNVYAGVSVKWTAVSGADKYRVLYKTSSGSWTKAGDTTSTSYTVPSSLLTSGKTYYFTVKCVSADGKTSTSKYNTTGKKVFYLSGLKPSTMTNTSSGIKLTWTKVTGAKGYYIYRKSGSGSYTKVKDITSGTTVSYTDTAVKTKNGINYTYYVRAYSGTTKGGYSSKSLYRLTGVSLTSVKRSAAGKLAVKWKKNDKATGYQLQYSTSSTFASGNKTTSVSGASTLSKTLTSLTVGKTYYVRVRVYKTNSAGTKQYSAWSAKLSARP